MLQLVPNAGKAYEDLLRLEISPSGRFTDAAANNVPLGTTNYFRKGLEIEQQQ